MYSRYAEYEGVEGESAATWYPAEGIGLEPMPSMQIEGRQRLWHAAQRIGRASPGAYLAHRREEAPPYHVRRGGGGSRCCPDNDISIEIDPNDVRVDVYRASGPGGQCVNTTDSAVRLTHIPTGIVVTCQNEKSQLQNKEAALQRLCAVRLYEREEQARAAELAELKGEKMDNSFGSQIRNYVLYPYRLIKDTRSNIESGNVDAALDGDIDQFVIGYHRWRASQ